MKGDIISSASLVSQLHNQEQNLVLLMTKTERLNPILWHLFNKVTKQSIIYSGTCSTSTRQVSVHVLQEHEIYRKRKMKGANRWKKMFM